MARFVRFAREEFPWIVGPVLAAALGYGAWRLYLWYTASAELCGFTTFP